MLPEIGLMVGAYIITRMLTFAVPPEKNGTFGQALAPGAAIVTILISGGVVYDLFVRGTKLSGF